MYFRYVPNDVDSNAVWIVRFTSVSVSLRPKQKDSLLVPGAVCAIFFHHIVETGCQRCSCSAGPIWVLLFEKRPHKALFSFSLHVRLVECSSFFYVVTDCRHQEHVHRLYLDDAVSGYFSMDHFFTNASDTEDESAV